MTTTKPTKRTVKQIDSDLKLLLVYVRVGNRDIDPDLMRKVDVLLDERLRLKQP